MFYVSLSFTKYHDIIPNIQSITALLVFDVVKHNDNCRMLHVYCNICTTHVYYPDFKCKILSDRHTLIELKSVMSKNEIK